MTTDFAGAPPASAGDAPAAIEISGLRQAYRTGGKLRTVLDVPSLTVPDGATVGLAGPSGSGKTTLLNLCAGILSPSAGSVRVTGVELAGLGQAERDRLRARRIGYVFQSFNLIPALTAIENVLVAMEFGRVVPRAERRDRATALLREVGLGERLGHRPAALSHGEMQRVGIARALANTPRLLIADEPTASLEPGLGARLVDLVKDMARRAGATLIVASHDPGVLARFERVIDLGRPSATPEDAG